ncbi:MAG: hypothetical protein IJU61_00300 [Victivallales bacterium]|nr:hypothetical protein [Bacteroidales bacterium]MBQ9444998.1 hypothetical protein [Victivallales bacterium]
MTEADMRMSCPNVWKSYRAKKGAVTRIAKKSKHLNVKVQYTDYHEKPSVDSETILHIGAAEIIGHGLWDAVQAELVRLGKIPQWNVDFCILHVVGFGDGWQQVTGEVVF